jgi:DNA-binding CsgD family transcriptional regulator/PAS domain-containing protein
LLLSTLIRLLLQQVLMPVSVGARGRRSETFLHKEDTKTLGLHSRLAYNTQVLPQERLLSLVGRIYDAAADVGLWPAFLHDLADAVGGTTTAIVQYDLQTWRGSLVAGVRFDPEYARRWCNYYSTVDEWFFAWKRHVNSDGPESVVTSEELVDLAKLKRTEFFNDYLLPQDTIHQFGGAIALEDQWCVGITCLRSHQQGPFRSTEVELLRLLFPHLQRAMQFHKRMSVLQGHYRASLDALDRLPSGVILIDDKGRMLEANVAAKEILSQNDGLTIEKEGLAASTSNQTRELRSTIAAAAFSIREKGFSAGGSLAIVRPSGKRPFVLVIMPASVQAFPPDARRAAAIVFVTDPEAKVEMTPEALARLYGLTGAESRLVEQLMQGESLVHAAERLGISHNTARTHLQRIYQKTETSHQGQLLKLLVSGITCCQPLKA